MSGEDRRAARDEALARVTAAHRPLAAVFDDLRRAVGAGAPPAPAEQVAPDPPGTPPEKPAPVDVVAPGEEVLPADEPAPDESVAPAEQLAEGDEVPDDDRAVNTWLVQAALAEGRVPRQRFGDPYCPAAVCYGRDYRVLDADVLAADGAPPYADDCNCTVILD